MSKKKELKLSYISPSLWWKRKLSINSKKWKDLRIKVLKRDDYQCYFCQIRANKYMIIDHISGDAQDNRLKNLRVLCPLCDTIRHAGLAGIMGTLKIASSKLSQIEIVKKTQEFFLKNKILPTIRQLDSFARLAKEYSPIDIATLEEEEIPKELKIYKGFFTKNATAKGKTKFLMFLLS